MKRLLSYLRSRMTYDEFELYCHDFITVTAIGAMLLLGWVYYESARSHANAFVPGQLTAEPVSCDGRPDCHTQVFVIDNGRRAFCAFWGKRRSQCVVETRSD